MELHRTLAVLPRFKVGRTARGAVILPRAFIDEMKPFVEHWDGPITAFLEPTEHPEAKPDDWVIDSVALPFQLEIGSYSDPGMAHRLSGRRLVLGWASHRQNHLARICRRVGAPLVYVADSCLKERLETAWTGAFNAAEAFRRHCWELNQERQFREAVGRASGVQCNGTATFEAYRPFNPNAILFFDAGTTHETLSDEAELEARLAELTRGRPLRLTFTGRLSVLEGGDQLIRVADELRRLGVPFELTIRGVGTLEPRMKADAARAGLGAFVTFTGGRDAAGFGSFSGRQADLFVSCVRSGQASRTYLESMACGAPIIGYETEALASLVRESGGGWTTPLDRSVPLASRIAELHGDRRSLVDASRRALAFARLWTFEETFKARIEHLKTCSTLGLPASNRGGRLAVVGRSRSDRDERIESR